MKKVFSVVLLFIVILFIVQNYEVVEIRFLNRSFMASRALVMFLALLIGMTIGRVFPLGRHRRSQEK